jgi:4-hydroxy-tetrahydrodipicolinate reductase
MTKAISVVGAAGRMGKQLITVVHEDAELTLAKGVEDRHCSNLGKDLGILAGFGETGVPVTDSKEAAFADADGVIDFSSPLSTLETLTEAQRQRIPVVIGTTGFSPEQRESISNAGQKIPILIAPNMSIGVNTLFRLVEKAAAILAPLDFDVEITEAHHRFKKDSPSGTAVKLAQIIEKSLQEHYGEAGFRYGRQGHEQGDKKRNEVGIHSLRAGDIVGEHTVSFAALGERIELTHKAHTRDTFAGGAVAAIKFLMGQEPGLYDMSHVLKL